MDNEFLALAKPAYLNSELTRPDWTKDISRPEGPLWLNKNENIDPILNKKIRSLVGQVKDFSFNTYPETAKIYSKLSRLDNLNAKCFLLTSGSDGAIRTVFDVFIQPSDKVLYTNPTFAMYEVYAKMFGAKSILFNYEYNANGPTLAFDKFIHAIETEKPKLICLPNPDSPTGTVLGEAQIDILLKTAIRLRSLVLIDEAYYPFYPKTVIGKINDFRNLLVCRSFSKAWGAAGLRAGYLVANEGLMNAIQKNRGMYELPTLTTEILNLLLDCQSDVLASVQRIEEGKLFFVNELTELGYTTTQSFGNFVHVDFKNDEKKISKALEQTVLYRVDFNSASCLRGFARFSLAPKEQMQLIIEKIKSVMI